MKLKKLTLFVLALLLMTGMAGDVAAVYMAGCAVPRKTSVTEWREEFKPSVTDSRPSLPANWILQTKPGTKPAVFRVEKNPDKNGYFLHMEADKASASLIMQADGVDITKTPFLRWQWRVLDLPKGADGRIRSKDDQAIGIYIGTGSAFNNKSISYRWDTDTPKGESGNATYGMGNIKIKWFTLKNKEDLKPGIWVTEERNVAEDFKNAWGFYPDKVYISISCNSQYTDSSASADLDWIEFRSQASKLPEHII